MLYKINRSLISLEDYMLREKFRGYDPFDALISPLFRLTFLKKNHTIRFLAQQSLKRMPINIRTLMKIKKGYNPVTLGLVIQAQTNLMAANENGREYKNNIDSCISELIRMQSEGYSGTCWGYDFDWEGRYARINAFTPTIVATGIITNALFEYYQLSNNKIVKDLIIRTKDFVINDLNRVYDGDTFCFSYSPLDYQIVYNATMKAARLLVQIYSFTSDVELLKLAKRTVTFVMKNQSDDGRWPYSKGDGRTWSDNFHTAYILDCLNEYIRISGDLTFSKNLEKGINYYINNFIKPDGMPKYFNNRIYPIDSTSASQSIITLSKFGYFELAEKVVQWMILNMQSKDGYFYYQKHKYFTNKISYMRWSNAWMYTALTKFMLYHE